MTRFPFTDEAIAQVDSPPTGRVWIHDSSSAYLKLMVTANGAKTFYVYRKVCGNPQRFRIGRHPLVSVDAARDRATRISSDICNGLDPARRRRGRPGAIYFALDTRGLCKIGFTMRDVDKRLDSLRTTAAIDWVSIRTVQVGRAMDEERQIHQRYAALSHRHEWFKMSVEQMNEAVEWCIARFASRQLAA